MLKIDREKYFDTLDYVNELNRVEFTELDLSDFFTNCDDEMKTKISERLTKMNNYNKIYVLIAYENLRDEFGLILAEKK